MVIFVTFRLLMPGLLFVTFIYFSLTHNWHMALWMTLSDKSYTIWPNSKIPVKKLSKFTPNLSYPQWNPQQQQTLFRYFLHVSDSFHTFHILSTHFTYFLHISHTFYMFHILSTHFTYFPHFSHTFYMFHILSTRFTYFLHVWHSLEVFKQ